MEKLFIPAHSLKNPAKAVGKARGLLKGYKRVGIVTTAQHINQRDNVKKILEKEGYEAVWGGQILGCDLDAAKKIDGVVDAFLYVGSGRFHPLGVAYTTKKPVVMANPLSDSVSIISKEDILQFKGRRKARIVQAYGANIFGILVSTKEGQFNLETAFEIKDRLETAGRRGIIFAGSEISPDNVLPFKVDAWVNTACPRIVDDFFDKPVLNEGELKNIVM